MDTPTQTTQNWLTKPPAKNAIPITLLMTYALMIVSILFWRNDFNLGMWLSALPAQVFDQSDWWRLWTALFVHKDAAHLMSNLVLFFPFCYFLSGYFSFYFFPLFGVLLGGIVNFITLQTLSATTILMGFSGVVYWMGAAWITLYLLIEHRDRLVRRFAKVIFIIGLLFMPNEYQPNVSYMSHFLGFIFGILSGGMFYVLFRKQFLAAQNDPGAETIKDTALDAQIFDHESELRSIEFNGNRYVEWELQDE
jgi:rhomboid protease GluP